MTRTLSALLFFSVVQLIGCAQKNNSSSDSSSGGTSTTPVLIKGLASGVTSLAIDVNTACAVVSGQVECWGNVGTTNVHALPLYDTTSNGVAQIYAQSGLINSSTGSALFNGISIPFTKASDSNWIINGSEFLLSGCPQEGTFEGAPGTCFRTPFKIPGLNNATEVFRIDGNTDSYNSAGFCAILTDGSIQCWGTGAVGAANTMGPVAPTGLAGTFIAASGGGHVCATTGSGASCWGPECFGELGDGGGGCSVQAPVSVVGLSGTISGIAAYEYRSCAIADGGVLCWGKMGLPSGYTFTPTAVSGLSSGVTAISMGGGEGTNGVNCAIQSGGLFCWGYQQYGELGDGYQYGSAVTSPTVVSGLSSGVTAVSVGRSNYTCAIKSGTVYCWGDSSYGKLGSNTTETCGFGVTRPCSTTPKAVSGLPSGATAIAAGNDTTCAIAQGAVYCWGANSVGMFGNQ